MFRSQKSHLGGKRARPLYLNRVVMFAWMGLGMAIAYPIDTYAAEGGLHRQSKALMGTKWHLALYVPDAESANLAFAATWGRLQEIDRALSNYRHDSEVNQLCRSAPHDSFVAVSNDLWQNLVAAHAISAATDGRFDVTIGPVSRLWRRARAKKRLPDSGKLQAARQAVGYRWIEFDTKQRAVKLTRPGMKLDLGGIAKGYAVDEALRQLQREGSPVAMVNGGGDMALGEPPPGEVGWQVQIAGPRPDSPRHQQSLARCGIATSGDAWQFVIIDGRRYSHLIDARTGLGCERSASATVIAPTCMQADAWASAMCIMPWAEARALLKERPRLQVRVSTLDASGDVQVRQTPVFGRRPEPAPLEMCEGGGVR